MTDPKQIEEEGITSLNVTSGFGHNTQQPFVQLLIPKADWMTQMSPNDARNLALNLLSSADAAESDGFLISFLRKTVGVDDMRAVVSILVEFREYRDQRLKEAGNAQVVHHLGRYHLVVNGLYVATEGDTVRDPRINGKRWDKRRLEAAARFINTGITEEDDE